MQTLNIVELIETNPICKLSSECNNKLLTKITEKFTNFEQQIKYPDGIYSLYNLSNSYNGQWAKIRNGVVTEVGTCGGMI
jgi:hypothetical protein